MHQEKGELNKIENWSFKGTSMRIATAAAVDRITNQLLGNTNAANTLDNTKKP